MTCTNQAGKQEAQLISIGAGILRCMPLGDEVLLAAMLQGRVGSSGRSLINSEKIGLWVKSRRARMAAVQRQNHAAICGPGKSKTR